MGEVTAIGLNLAKSIFQAHGADAAGEVVFRKKLRRDQLLSFFAGQPRCLVAMEACAGAHHWARELGAPGHDVRLIPPSYVKPFVKRQKNDMANAEAISEVAMRPTMRFITPKTAEAQTGAVIFRTLDLLVRQRTSAQQRDPRSSGGVRLSCAAGPWTRRPAHHTCGRSDEGSSSNARFRLGLGRILWRSD